MRVGRPVCALVVSLALAIAVPSPTPRGCADCPPGCPMHAGVRGPEKGSRQPGCHRAIVPASDGVCLRATCGRDATGESSGLTPATLRTPSRLALALVPEADTVRDFRFTWLAPPAPPTDPPRSVLG